MNSRLLIIFFICVSQLANASECFSNYPDLCLESVTYSDHFAKSIGEGDKLSGAWVVFCMNQIIYSRSSSTATDPKYKLHFQYAMPVCYGPDADQSTRACNSGLFSRFEPQAGGKCIKQYLFLQAGEYEWTILASKNYTDQPARLVVTPHKSVRKR
ncbi:MAG: hypothetical protein KDD46_00115 [Bdellovibrionales bacterium]|mgnify:CR=1 FL=1|nr:hypothetical protein [Bdellovibrionales bacterium]